MTTQSTPSDDRSEPANPAVDLIRQKLQQAYANEPSARDELQDIQKGNHTSPHQKFMYELSQSGRSLADIQTAWHNYYVALPDTEKHRVWQEFYAEHSRRGAKNSEPTQQPKPPVILPIVKQVHGPHTPTQSQTRNVTEIKQQILNTVHHRTSYKRGSHLKSIAFGLSSGLIVVAVLLFGLFNERILAPFISPSKSVSSTPIIIDPTSTAVGPETKIIIPKINVEIPVVYNEPSIEEDAVQKALERGVLHYATTSKPGELGNGAIFGHSSNNILNKGDYKFAFVLLKRLEAGDTFILQKDSKRYVYRVFDKKVVKPEDLSVLSDSQGKPATFSLITCDPPGTTINRMVVTGEQITPDVGTNLASSAKNQQLPKTLPSDSESLWQRFTAWLVSS